jgi:hypothetical protein
VVCEEEEKKLKKKRVTVYIFVESLFIEFVSLLFLQVHRETGRAAFSSQIKSKVGNILAKDALWITLNIDGVPIVSKSHTHPSHSETSRLLTSSLSLGVPVPHATQCMRVV